MIREASVGDAGYFIGAAKEFCEKSGHSFNADSFAEKLFIILTSPNYKVFVLGDPVRAHCGMSIDTSLYDDSVLVAKVITTWGNGGMRCFRHAMNWARENGINLFIADSYLEPRVEDAYKEAGMKKTDTLYIARLNDGT